MQPEIEIIQYPQLCDYVDIWQKMKCFTEERDKDSSDQIWCLQHHPVFTLGQAGKVEHILQRSAIPIVESDRGGQVTYHGPGQIILYVLLDLRRRSLGVRHLVTELEATVIQWLAEHDVLATAREDAPGVYVDEAKIAALGLRVRKGCSFHGLSVNVDLDLKPFDQINPCGYVDMPVTQIKDHDIRVDPVQVGIEMANILISRLSQRST